MAQSKKQKKIQIELKRKASALTKKDVKFEKPVSFKGNKQLLKQKTKNIPNQKVTNVFQIDDLDESAKDKARDWYKNIINEGGENFFAEDQGIIFDDTHKLDSEEMGLNSPMTPSTFDVGSGGGEFIQYDDLEIKDEKKFAKYLGLPKSLEDKVHPELENGREGDNTRLVFRDNTGGNTEGTGGEIDISGEASSILEHYEGQVGDGENDSFHKEDVPTVDEAHDMVGAFDRFADMMDDSLKHLKNNYESQFLDENVDENIRINEYEFDEDGNRV